MIGNYLHNPSIRRLLMTNEHWFQVELIFYFGKPFQWLFRAGLTCYLQSFEWLLNWYHICITLWSLEMFRSICVYWLIKAKTKVHSTWCHRVWQKLRIHLHCYSRTYQYQLDFSIFKSRISVMIRVKTFSYILGTMSTTTLIRIPKALQK